MLPYKKDNARIENAEVADGIHKALTKAYEESGHEIVQVPVMPVGDRADFILDRIA
jgi:predicted ATPase